jgi:hypothetical protein
MKEVIDKIHYTQIWYNIMMKLYNYKMDGEYMRYCIGVEGFISTLLPDERDKVKAYMKTIIEPIPFPEKLGYYDKVFEHIIYVLNKAGFLTKQVIQKESGVFSGKIEDNDV